jgi:hypothetical protein
MPPSQLLYSQIFSGLPLYFAVPTHSIRVKDSRAICVSLFDFFNPEEQRYWSRFAGPIERRETGTKVVKEAYFLNRATSKGVSENNLLAGFAGFAGGIRKRICANRAV